MQSNVFHISAITPLILVKGDVKCLCCNHSLTRYMTILNCEGAVFHKDYLVKVDEEHYGYVCWNCTKVYETCPIL